MTVSYNKVSFLNNGRVNEERINAGVLTAPIETVQRTVESGVDTFVNTVHKNESEEKKKTRKKAIAAGSAVLVLGGLTMILNPKGSTKMLARMKSLQNKLDIKLKHNKDNFLKSKFYGFCKKTYDSISKGMNIYFNFNSSKDIAFQSLCVNSNKKYPEFITKNKNLTNAIKKVDDVFVKIFNKPHKGITKFFDKISQNTVKRNYSQAAKDLDKLDEMLKVLKESLTGNDKKLVEAKIKEISKARMSFSEKAVVERMNNMENIMQGIDKDLWNRIYNKNDGFAKNSTTFWVQDFLKPKKEIVEKEGKTFVNNLVGAEKQKGLYDDVINILRKNLGAEKTGEAESLLSKASKRLKKANHSECIEYFDKKRDLIVGGAPTDIVTQLFMTGACGLAVGQASKEDRLSVALTKGIPIMTGLLSSLVFSALLFSGPIGLLAGIGVGGVTSIICGAIDKHVFGNDDKNSQKANIAAKNNKLKSMEVKNA